MEAGVTLLPEGGIAVDEHVRTTRPGIYAAGDVTGRDQFVYMAACGARLAAENALSGDTHRYDHSAMPSVVFTDLQVASVGLTKAAARATGYEVKTATLAIKGGLTTGDLADTIFPYLTTVEGLKLAARAFTRDVTKLSCCA